MFLQWFATLPLFLELPGVSSGPMRVGTIALSNVITNFPISRLSMQSLFKKSTDKDSFEGQLLDRLTRGTDIKLPDKRIIRSKDGHERRFFSN